MLKNRLNTAILQNKLQSTVESFPWYGQLLADMNVDPHAPISLDQLPLMTSEVLEKFYYSVEQPFANRSDVTFYRTSGTSSHRRKTIYYSAEDEERYVGLKSALFQRLLQHSSVRSVLSDMGTGHAANTAVEVFRGMGLEVDSMSFQQPIEEHLVRIQTFQPQVLYTMPSILERLLSESPNNLAASGIRKVILVGEIASPTWLLRVAERLGIAPTDITDTYGSIEIGTIAYYSHEHGRYLFVEGIEAEGVAIDDLYSDVNFGAAAEASASSSSDVGAGAEASASSSSDVGASAEASASSSSGADSGETSDFSSGDESVLVLTSLTRDLFPSLRYVTYDIVRDLRPIQVDGQWRMSFQAIVRRIGTELKHGEKISIYDIENVVYRHIKEAHIRIHVHANKLTVHIDSKEQDPILFSRIELELLECIPEIGDMIRGRLLDGLKVTPSSLTFDRSTLKHKRIFYD